jgi:hypothetical protein
MTNNKNCKNSNASTKIIDWETIDFGDGTTTLHGRLKSDPRVTFNLYQGVKKGKVVWGGTAELIDCCLVRTHASQATMRLARDVLEAEFQHWCRDALDGPKQTVDQEKSGGQWLELTGDLAKIKHVEKLNRMFMLHRVFQPHMFSSIAFIPKELIQPLMDLVAETGHGKLKKAIYISGTSVPVAGKEIDWDDALQIEIEDEESGDVEATSDYWSEIFLFVDEGVQIKFKGERSPP